MLISPDAEDYTPYNNVVRTIIESSFISWLAMLVYGILESCPQSIVVVVSHCDIMSSRWTVDK
jgi:hypothetical protein